MAARDWWTAEFAEVKPLRIRAFLAPSFRVFIVLDTCRGVKANIILDGLMEKHYSLGVQWLEWITTVGGLPGLQLQITRQHVSSMGSVGPLYMY